MPGGLMRAAATASMISSARLNREQRKAVANYNEHVTTAPTTQATPAPVATTPTQVATDDVTAQLQQLASLHQQRILTDEEFSAKKKQLLGI